ncbi:hypothetical protein WME95_21010 [Sorangium sp. So ce327]|jgi:hypothetical protein|uniref:hypothetical protein n=1 Tax=Sorangium sp. So ce327 TaxID=3133301 RepID=UPI003F5D8422
MQAHRVAQARPADRTVSPWGLKRRRVASLGTVGLLALSGAAAARADPAQPGDPTALAGAQPARPSLPPAPPAQPPAAPERPAAAAPRTQPRAAANFSTFLELRDDYSSGKNGFFNAAVLRGDYAFTRTFSLRADLPLAYAGDIEGRRDAGLGDILIRPLVRVVGTPRFALVVGTDLVLDSATKRALGAGKNQVAPLVQAYFRVARPARLGAQLQHAVSFGGDPGRNPIQKSTIREFAIIELPHGFWVSPDQAFSIDHRGAHRVVSTSVLEVGAELSERVQVYVDPGIQVDDRGAVDWLITGAVRWAFPQRARARAVAAAPVQRAGTEQAAGAGQAAGAEQATEE